MPSTRPLRQQVRRVGAGAGINNRRSLNTRRSLPFFVVLPTVLCVIALWQSVFLDTSTPALDTQKKHLFRNSGGNVTSTSFKEDANFPDHYLTFSTSCSTYQNWQSFFLFYSAHKVNQPGQVIRIVSGCTATQRTELEDFHKTVIKKLSPNFHIHFTPDFSRIGGDDDSFVYYNKPFGMQHFMTHWLKYDDEESNNNEKLTNSIIILLDPDMILLRPLTCDFTSSNVMIHKSSEREPPKVKKVLHGQPWASLYGYRDEPFTLDLKYIFANHTDSPAFNVTIEEQLHNYAGGPPYMATGKDMWAIVHAWTELVPHVRHVQDGIMGEMYGWVLGAAHLRLPHTLAESFMISATQMGDDEGWPLIDSLKDEEVCEYHHSVRTKKEYYEDKLPYTIHYCQQYWLGKWYIGKFRLDSDFLTCGKELLMEPPKNISKEYDFFIKPGWLGKGKSYGEKEPVSPEIAKREAFMICQLISLFNDAAAWFKDTKCEEGTAKYEKSFIFHHSLDPDINEGGEKKVK